MAKKIPRIGRCNRFSTGWAAIYGCLGTGKFIRWEPGHFSTIRAQYACDVCLANEGNSQADLRTAQDAAGIADYRTLRMLDGGQGRLTKVDGRPVIVRAETANRSAK